jgi:hypothetical protein
VLVECVLFKISNNVAYEDADTFLIVIVSL